jgi:MscS family membrane protein
MFFAFWDIVQESVSFLFTKATQAEWAEALTYLSLGLLGAWIAGRWVQRFLRRYEAELGPETHRRIVRAAMGPVRLLVLFYFALLAFDAFTSMPSALWQRVHTHVYPLLNGIILLVLAFRLVDIISSLLKHRFANSDTELDQRWADLFGIFGKLLVVGIAGLVILSTLGIDVLPLLTGASFLGAAVALASKETIANAIGSLEIMLDRLFKEGDRISFGEYDGFVTKMGLRTVELTSLTGEKINLPNKDLVDKQIRNYSRNRIVRTTIVIGITYERDRASVENAIALMKETIAAHGRVRSCEAGLESFGDFALHLEAIFWADYRTDTEYKRLMNELHLSLKEKFDAAKIDFAYPASVVHLVQQRP